MPARDQRVDERAADHAAGAGHQDAHAPPSAASFAARVLLTGSLASVASTVMASCLGKRRTRSYASSSNATSHWIWGEEAKWRRRADLPHTLVGYGIHHASSLFWATGFEALMATRRPPAPLVAAAATTLAAYMVDYHVVPGRLRPGFERHLRGRDLLATYVAFGAGLAAGALLRRQPRR